MRFNMIDSIFEQNNNELPHVIIPAWQELIQATCEGNLDRVNQLLEDPEVAAYAAANDNEALRIAARNGHLAIVNRLLKIPAVTEHAAALNNAALHWATSHGDLGVVNRLLEIPVVAAMATTRGNLLLWAAVKKGHLAIVNRLLEIPTATETAAALSSDALNWAVIYRKLEIVNRLLKIDSVCEIFTQYPDGFLAFFRDRLNDIYHREDYRSEPYDYEIELVETLREFAARNNIPLSGFSGQQNEVLKFATRTNKSLLSNLLACLEEPSKLTPDQHSFTQVLQFSSGAASSQNPCSDDLSPERDERDAKKSHRP